MTVCDRGCHLAKQAHCLILLQPLAGAHVWVHVSIVTLGEYVHLGLPEHHLWDLADVAVWKQTCVGCDELVILLNGKHLVATYQNKMITDPSIHQLILTETILKHLCSPCMCSPVPWPDEPLWTSELLPWPPAGCRAQYVRHGASLTPAAQGSGTGGEDRVRDPGMEAGWVSGACIWRYRCCESPQSLIASVAVEV